MVEFTLNGRRVEAERDAILMDVAREHGVEIPGLCYRPGTEAYASCRLCLVEVTQRGRTRIVTACTYPIRDDVVVETETEHVRRLRKMVLELLLAQAPGSEEIRKLAAEYGIEKPRLPVLGDNENEKCILCGLCERVCAQHIGAAGISFAFRGAERRITAPYDEPLEECIGCGACAFVCPTGAALERLVAGMMEIQPWEARVPIATCRLCGAPVGPRPALEQAAAKLEVDVDELLVCPACRRKDHVQELSRIAGSPMVGIAGIPGRRGGR